MASPSQDDARQNAKRSPYENTITLPILDKELPSIPELTSPALSLPTRIKGSPTPSPGHTSPAIPNGNSEAPDYLNGGLPHDGVVPDLLNSKPRSVHSAIEPTTAAALSDSGIPESYAEVQTPSLSPEPADRRSVQFSRSDVVIDAQTHTRHGSWDAGIPARSRAFMSRLKALAVQGGLPAPRAPSLHGPGSDTGGQSTASSPTIGRGARMAHSLNEDGSDADADAEETADEALPEDSAAKSRKKRRRMRRPKLQTQSTPGTPRLNLPDPDSPMVNRRSLTRRATMPDPGERVGLSEGEGRDHLTRESAWRRGSSWIGRSEDHEDAESPSGRRLGHIRRISVFGGGGGGGASDGDAMTPRRPFFAGDRASTFGAQKWRQVKNTLKLLRQKKEQQFDYYKSAELMAELRAGAPAVLMLASMIQRDEHGNKRIPVLLEQLRLRITDSSPVEDGESERHWLFTIELEYGSGPSRMRWTVKRTIREILNLHWKYKLDLRNDKYLHTIQLGARPKQPRFPISAFPYVRGLRGVDASDEDDGVSNAGDDAGEGTAGEGTAGEATATEAEGRIAPRRRKSRMAMLGMSRKSSTVAGGEDQGADAAMDEALARRRYIERQQRMLEKYLQEMIRWLMFRADSNRLCRFLELSALGVRLAAEGSYHGKECFLHIQSSKGLDFRRVLTPAKVIERHSRKWFLVRSSYIVCVESAENMNIYDVYLVDPKFKIISKKNKLKQIGSKDKAEEVDLTSGQPHRKHHTITLMTSERKVKLWARNQHLIRQFEESITDMLKQTPWHQHNRFNSFAPVRTGVFAQWLVDGRDYMWNVSRAISMAKDVIYIHDWWLSPELYMRRPACISQKWRLDRLLQRKAREGVKIFVIIYRNVEAAIPIDSEYTKFALLNLHHNIFVQRSPNQFKKNQFFFAHHEKICIVDHDVAFVGGLDLCFGRWDSPEHLLHDDKPTGFEPEDNPKDAEHCQLWPGKDYSNARVQDFYSLREPYKEMYDRTRVPRMPWHDISMQVVGQPARDLTRHFVQRWNYLRRGRKPTRPIPFLLPPPDSNGEELENLGLTGTCEVQILRSASTWSLGIDETEASIQNAYISMIEESEHFVYMENQFFITSTETLNVKILNRIGDALVERIIRANENDEDWRCVIIIPLLPGFQNSVADQDGTSVRLILQCQFRSICRGDDSIFGRLKTAGIEPEDYIQFFSLRQWGRINHGTVLTTEQLYIHAKTIIIDDRVALIGSANINERSLLGDRDSECAAIVRDRDMLWSTMGGKPYQVGRFAHTLRLRLMREHLGLDTDEILAEDRQADMERENEFMNDMNDMYSDDSDASPTAEGSRRPRSRSRPLIYSRTPSINRDVDLEELESHVVPEEPELDLQTTQASGSKSQGSGETKVVANHDKQQKDVEGFGEDRWRMAHKQGIDQGRDSVIIDGQEVLVNHVFGKGENPLSPSQANHHHHHTVPNEVLNNDECSAKDKVPPMPPFNRRTTDQLGLLRTSQLPTLPLTDDTDIGGPPLHLDTQGNPSNGPVNPLMADIRLADVTRDCMRDPLNPNFYNEVWARVAENNTKIYRRVFRCMPDSEVTNWHEFQEFITYGARFQESMEGTKKSEDPERKSESHPPRHGTSGGAGIGAPSPGAALASVGEKIAAVATGGGENKKEKESSGEFDEKAKEKEPFPAAPLKEKEPHTDMEKAAEAERALKEHDTHVAGGPTAPTKESESAIDDSQPAANKPDKGKERRATFSALEKPPTGGPSTAASTGQQQPAAAANGGSVKRRRRAGTKGSRRGFQGTDDLLTKAEADDLCGMIQGHLVQFPYDWLLVEEGNGNWLYQVDQVAPLQI
ncbi:uncharacterized protein E0L32_007123 [Thyridium curvatum]|uniref:Phospholipase D1 n=1 Tax=Thyridium curvatum TaxID=1093900 RepID=A0A507AXL1_9PEZI|nr:uncharacterized protein E0L32_007123 [Thyridium curvatum]TPX12237.1 hypothetical protein E0L32_007123 [Thyridium curvatum]